MSSFHAKATLALGFAFVTASACSSRPPVYDGLPSGSSGTTSGGDGGLISNGSDAGPPKFACADLKSADGKTCDCFEVDLLTDPPNIYFVLDRSGSMIAENKWTKVRGTVGSVVKALGPRANIGAAVYPGDGVDACVAGTELMAVRPGDAPGTNTNPNSTFLTLARALDLTQASGGTPTRATIAALTPKLMGLPGKTFVVLATDGGPNCTDLVCDTSECILNIEGTQLGPNTCSLAGPNCCAGKQGLSCLDDDGTEQEIAKLAAARIPTYVIGIPGAGPYSNIMDRFAKAGGTARPTAPLHYQINQSTEQEFTAVLKKVAAQIVATCDFELKTAPEEATVNVYLDNVVTPKDPTNGWKVEGKKVTMLGTSCQRIKDGDVLDVRIVVGCPSVLK